MSQSLRRVLLLTCLALLVSDALGFGGSVVRMPSTTDGSIGYTVRSGLNLELDTRWFEGGGYHPVRLRATAATPSSGDRRIAVTLRFADPRRRRGANTTVRREIVLPAGETEAEVLIPCPAPQQLGTVWWSVEVDGEAEPTLSMPATRRVMLAPSQRSGGLNLAHPDVTAGDGLADERTVYREGSTQGRRGRRWPESVGCEFMEDWVGYSSADVLTFEFDELLQLAEESPDELRAVRRWLLAGGTVWVENAAQGRADADESAYCVAIDRSLGLASWRFQSVGDEIEEVAPPNSSETVDSNQAAGSSVTTESSVAAEGDGVDGPATDESADLVGLTGEVDPAVAAPVEKKNKRIPLEDAPGWSYLAVDGPNDVTSGVRQLLENGLAGLFESGDGASTRGWYSQRDAGFGRVMAFNQQAFRAPPSSLPQSAGREVIMSWRQRSWGARHGIEPDASSAEFGNWLVPGVGVAPVNEFQVLITVFVLMIGPLNYWLLWRRQQLQLLVVTTPLCALAFTLGLAAYASIADGFGVKARARSVTLIDQTTGEAASWSRVSHYVATAPDEPALFPQDSVIYPIRPAWESAIAEVSPDRTVQWTDEGQRLVSGWTPSRTAVQHLVVRCRESDARVLLNPQGSTLEAVNRLGAPIDLLLVRDEAGDWSRVRELEAGAASRAESVEWLEAMQDLRELCLKNLPQFPLGAGRAVEETMERLGKRQDLRRLVRTIGTASMSDNLLNQQIDELTGLGGGRGLDLPPRSYVAITGQAVETPLGWESVKELGSFHVVVGRW